MPRRSLSLKRETFADLSDADLSGVAGAGWTGQVDCIASFDPCLTIVACTRLCDPR